MNLFDLHCDTPFELYKKQMRMEDSLLHISLKKAEVYSKYAQVMAIWTQHSLDNEEAWKQFHAIYRDFIFFLAVEGASLLDGKIERLGELYKLGVRFLTLVWRDSDIIGGAFNTSDPLTPFGREVVRGCFALGITVDLSHASDAVANECLALAQESRRPVVATHSNSRRVYPHPRNLTDEQLRTLARTGGVAQVTLYHGFLRLEGEATIVDAVDHLCHMIDVAGIDHVGIGTDFDGDGGIRGCASASELLNFTRHLLLRRFSEADLELIWGGNFLRVIRQVQQAAAEGGWK